MRWRVSVIFAILMASCSKNAPEASVPTSDESKVVEDASDKTFLDYCKAGQAENTPGAWHTVEAMKAKVAESDCDAAWQKLAGLEILYLVDNQITDITPLAGLTGLEALDGLGGPGPQRQPNHRHHTAQGTGGVGGPVAQRQPNHRHHTAGCG